MFFITDAINYTVISVDHIVSFCKRQIIFHDKKFPYAIIFFMANEDIVKWEYEQEEIYLKIYDDLLYDIYNLSPPNLRDCKKKHKKKHLY